MESASRTDEGQVYQLDKLMEETRSLAGKYRQATGQTLPVTHDLACYDAIRLLGLSAPGQLEASIDAVLEDGSKTIRYTIKGRVQFASNKGKQQRIGQLNMDTDWHYCLLVLMDDDYMPTEILQASHATIDEVMADKSANKRGAMSVAQFRKIASTVWSNND
jgi:hypothetical protein